MALPRPPRLAIFDLDGVVYRGDVPVPGAVAAIAALERAGIGVRYATNNSTVSREVYVARLAAMGIATSADRVVTSTSATIEHLRRHLPEVRSTLTLGGPGMLDELTAAGFDAHHAAEVEDDAYHGGPLRRAWDALIVGLDRRLTYRSLGIAAGAVREGARFIATNADQRYPTPDGFLPGAGAVVAAVAVASGREPTVIGKPSPAMFGAILEAAGCAPEEAVVIGDNPDADIVAARRGGIASVLVLTGVADAAAAAALAGERRPDLVLAGPGELPAALGIGVS